MTIPFYIQGLLMGLFGTIAAVLLAIRSLSIKAKAANIQFKASDYLKSDWYSPCGSIVAVGVMLIALGHIPPSVSPLIELGFFFLAGYGGNDILFKLYSVTNNRLTSALDYKTTIADTATGTLNAPTPATPPK